MTNQNYTSLSNEELVSTINELNIYIGKLNNFLEKHYPKLFNEIVIRTNFLDDFYKNRKVPFPARLFCLKNNLNSQPLCQNPNCHNIVEWCKKEHNFRKYCCRYCQNTDENLQHKREITNIARYGHKCSFQSEIVREKYKKNYMVEHGVDNPFKLISVKDKIKNTMLDKYGVDNYTKTNEYIVKTKRTNNIKYGTDYYSQSKEYKENIPKIHKKSMKKWILMWNECGEYEILKYKKGYVNNQYQHIQRFDSKLEIRVFIFCNIEHNINCTYQPNIPFEYIEENGCKHIYCPDFLINGKVYEVKGEQFFRINKDTGEEEMYCPYRNGKTDEEYERICKRENAKLKCMLRNNVRILREQQIQNLTLSMFD